MLEWDCDRLVRNDRVIWASCMVASGDADAMVQETQEDIPPL